METILLRQAAPLASARGRCAAAPQTPRCIRRRRRIGVCAAKTSRRSVPDPFPPPPVAADGPTTRDSTGRDETAPAGYLIAAGQQKREGITPPALVPRPLLLYVLALRGWRPCRLSPASRGKCLRRNGPSPASLTQRRRERQSYPGASGGPDSAANRAAGRADTPRWMAVALHGGPGGSPAALCHFLSAEKVRPGPPVRPE